MKRISIIVPIFIFTIIFGIFALNYLGLTPSNNNSPKTPQQTSQGSNSKDGFNTEIIATNLNVPWRIIFTSKDRLLVTQRSGSILQINLVNKTQKELIAFSEVSSKAEEGLMGITKDPKYSENKYLYACLAYQRNSELFVKIVRLKDKGESIEKIQTLADDIKAAKFHAGCDLAIGPDNLLYATTGDATDKSLPQSDNSLSGKILTMDLDGKSIKIYAKGFRNSQGIAWDASQNMYAIDHGPSIFDGPAGGDELNLITKNGNYGWPEVSHEKTDSRFISPLLVYTPAQAPSSIMIYQGEMFPDWKDSIFITALRGESLIRVVKDPQNPSLIKDHYKIPGVEFGRLRDVTEAPDGSIYIATSNTDGRGSKRESDDKIIRLFKP